MQPAKTMIIFIHHPHGSRGHGHHAEWEIELPERRALAAPGPRALQLTIDPLYTSNKSDTNQ